MRDGESTPLEKLTQSDGGFTEETVFNFSENSFESGEPAMTLTDVFNRVYILSGKTTEGGESAILCKITGGSPESGYRICFTPMVRKRITWTGERCFLQSLPLARKCLKIRGLSVIRWRFSKREGTTNDVDETPGKLRFLTFDIDDLWVGAGLDLGRFAYVIEMGKVLKYVVTRGYVGYWLKIDETILKTTFFSVNGEWCFQGGIFILYKSTDSNWILMESDDSNLTARPNVPPGYKPVSWDNRETEKRCRMRKMRHKPFILNGLRKVRKSSNFTCHDGKKRKTHSTKHPT
ncbi:MAG: hypothetical protein Q4D62_05425 [Planctomycetia bacterium]|nr:hypothetical protein [Planctomycetia bacterium]